MWVPHTGRGLPRTAGKAAMTSCDNRYHGFVSGNIQQRPLMVNHQVEASSVKSGKTREQSLFAASWVTAYRTGVTTGCHPDRRSWGYFPWYVGGGISDGPADRRPACRWTLPRMCIATPPMMMLTRIIHGWHAQNEVMGVERGTARLPESGFSMILGRDDRPRQPTCGAGRDLEEDSVGCPTPTRRW